MSSTWQRVKARRQHGEIQGATAGNAALEAIRQRSYNGLGMPALPAVGPVTAPVRILNPDGSLREIVPAEVFRKRKAPAEEAELRIRKARRRGLQMSHVGRRKRAEGVERSEMDHV